MRGANLSRHVGLALVLIAALTWSGCGDDDQPGRDGGSGDATVEDAGPTDAGPTDAGPTDAGPTDAGPIDGAVTDTGVPEGRPFRGAPPSIPHDPYGCGIDCLTCHESGRDGAPVTPHPTRRICTMCHLHANTATDPFVGNTFRP